MRSVLVGVVSFGLALLLWLLDLGTPPVMDFAIANLLLIGLCAWFAGRRWALALAVVAGVASYMIDAPTGRPVVDAVAALVRLAANIGTALVVALLRERDAYLRNLDRFRMELIASLARELPGRLADLDRLVRESAAAESGGAHADRLRRAVADLATLSRNFMTLGLIHETPSQRANRPIDLNEAVRDAVAGLSGQRRRVVVGLPLRPVSIRADKRPLTAGLSNLIEAALPLVRGYLDISARPQDGAAIVEIRPHDAEPASRGRAEHVFDGASGVAPALALADRALSVDLARQVVRSYGGEVTLAGGPTEWSLVIRFPLAP